MRIPYKNPREWYRWFAWYPVWVNRQWRWLEPVERSVRVRHPLGGIFDYRSTGKREEEERVAKE